MKITQNKDKIKELFEKYTQSNFIDFSRIDGYPIFSITEHQENFKYFDMEFVSMMQISVGPQAKNIVRVISAEDPNDVKIKDRQKKIDSL